MAYQKQTWVTGETITEQKLNHMEDGIANTILIVNVTREVVEDITVDSCDKTWQQIHDATLAVLAYQLESNTVSFVMIDGISENGDSYEVAGAGNTYTTDSPDGYPQSVGGK